MCVYFNIYIYMLTYNNIYLAVEVGLGHLVGARRAAEVPNRVCFSVGVGDLFTHKKHIRKVYIYSYIYIYMYIYK